MYCSGDSRVGQDVHNLKTVGKRINLNNTHKQSNAEYYINTQAEETENSHPLINWALKVRFSQRPDISVQWFEGKLRAWQYFGGSYLQLTAWHKAVGILRALDSSVSVLRSLLRCMATSRDLNKT